MSTARVDFTRGAAERIARVVRLVEQGDRGQSGPTWAKVDGGGSPLSLKRCSWGATWLHNAVSTITFLSNSQATATATNVFFGAGPGKGWVAKSGTSGWSLVSVDLTTQPGYDSSVIQLLGHNTTGPCLQWYSISTCGTATSTA